MLQKNVKFFLRESIRKLQILCSPLKRETVWKLPVVFPAGGGEDNI